MNLFDSKGPDRFGFQHQTLAECMAGAYLRRMGLIQLRSLLCKRDAVGEYVIPQLAEVAAWVAVDREDFFDHLVEIEPENLLRSDVTNLRAEQKARLTTALLEKTRRAEHFQDSDRRAFYAALSYQGLANLLRPYILDASLNVVVRWLAIDIAVACKLKELLDDFLSILRRGDDPVARQVGYALDDLVDEASAPVLIPVVDGTFQPHVSTPARRTALLGLLNTTWSVADSLPHLHELALSDHWLDWQVAPRIKQSDVIPILREMRNWRAAFNSQSCLHRVVDRTCSLALERIDEPEIAELLGAVIAQALADYSLPSRGEKGAFISRVSTDANARHALIRALMGQGALDDNALLHIASDLCLPEDLGWLLKELDVASESARERLAKIISYLSTPDRVASFWDLFLDRLERVPELKQHFTWLHAYEIEGPDGRAERARWKRQLRREKKHQRLMERHKTPPREELMARALSEVLSGKSEWWIGVADYAFITSERRREYGGIRHDITTSPEWHEATDERKEQIRNVARQFLLTRNKEVPREPKRSTNHADAAFMACWLLRDEIAVPGALQAAVAAYCVPSIVWYGMNEIEDHAELTKIIYALNAERCRAAFLEELQADANSELGLTLATRAFRTCWDKALSRIASDFLTLTMRRPETIRTLLGELAHGDPDAAKEVWRKMASSYTASADETAQSMGAMTEIIINDFLAEMWGEVLPFLERYPDVARYAFLHAAYYRRSRTEKPRGDLSETQLADFYLLLRSLFPPEDDPGWPEDGNGHTVTPRMEVCQFRDGVLQILTSRANETACTQLQRIAAEVPAPYQIWILRKHREAVELKRRQAWTPLDTETFLEVARRRDAYFVENEDDLMLVVLDSLGKLQRSLNASPEGDVLRFWHFDFIHNRRTNFRPHAEIDVAREIYSHLKRDLGGSAGAVVLREVAIRWDQKRTDIDVVVIADSVGSKRELVLTIEVKGCWNEGVREAVQSQLVEDYLRRAGRTRGIYLVAFFVCSKWEEKMKPQCALKSKSIEDARKEVAELCRPFSGATSFARVVPFVLDCRL